MKPLERSIEVRIEDLARRLRDLRKRSGASCHPTQEIWEEAVELCGVAPLSRVAQGIGVSGNGLRNRRKGTTQTKATPPSRFLEVRDLVASVPRVSPAVGRPCALGPEALGGIELSRRDGAVLRVSDLQAHGLDLGSLIQGFLSWSPSLSGGGLT